MATVITFNQTFRNGSEKEYNYTLHVEHAPVNSSMWAIPVKCTSKMALISLYNAGCIEYISFNDVDNDGRTVVIINLDSIKTIAPAKQ